MNLKDSKRFFINYGIKVIKKKEVKERKEQLNLDLILDVVVFDISH